MQGIKPIFRPTDPAVVSPDAVPDHDRRKLPKSIRRRPSVDPSGPPEALGFLPILTFSGGGLCNPGVIGLQIRPPYDR